jgi:hypothetical protein
MTLVKLSSRNGRKFRGIRMMEQNTFQPVTERKPGNRRSSDSAKSTISATHAASSSSVNKTLVAIRAFRPNEMKARSEKVMRLGSRSMHLARSLAVQAVTAAHRKSATMPQSQPAYLKPMGRLSKPTPIKTLSTQPSQQPTQTPVPKKRKKRTWSN